MVNAGGGALLGALVSLLVAQWLKLATEDDWRQVVFGFNGALVGIAVLFFFPLSVEAIAFIVGGSVLSSLLLRGMFALSGLPLYTAPFVMVTWGMLFLADILGLSQITYSNSEPFGDSWLAAISKGIGQVMFLESWRSGCLILFGLMVSSRVWVSR